MGQGTRQRIYLQSLFYLFFLIHYLWIYQSVWHCCMHIEFVWQFSFLFSHLPASVSVCLSGLRRPLLCPSKYVCYANSLSFFSLSFSFSASHLFLFYIFVIRLAPSILWSFILSLKHFKLWWWLANLSQINLMDSACTHSPHGCAFTAVLLIYSWNNTLQCPSFKPVEG